MNIRSRSEGQGDEIEVSPPPVDTDVGPWSTEAFDLFDWRPPGRGEEEEKEVGLLVDK